VFDRLRDGSGVSRWAVISDTGLKLGVSRESLRRWVNQAEIDQGERSGVTREESAEIRRLRKENAELRRTNEILKLASAFFALTDAGIRSSTGTIGDSYDNALAETVNGLYKTELIYSQTWRSCTEVEWATLNWVYWWNHQRLHESLDYSTPEEVITQYNQTHAKQLAPV
ncbi:integrase core domain-containing protein, partial [Mobiluncus holmesii]|uniref:integrase core domain-containing protein n=1 Tax=Mobiluncus holmesii TaxID=144178 RepID=UPI0012B67C82